MGQISVKVREDTHSELIEAIGEYAVRTGQMLPISEFLDRAVRFAKGNLPNVPYRRQRKKNKNSEE